MATTVDVLVAPDGAPTRRNQIDLAGTVNLPAGAMCFRNSNGWATDDANAGANPFAGFSADRYDNSAGANGELSGEAWTSGRVKFRPTHSLTQADVDKPVYATDNWSVQSASASASYLGILRQVFANGDIVVETAAAHS